MPTLRFHSVDAERIFAVSTLLLEDLTSIFKLAADDIGIEIIESKFIENGQFTNSYPMVEVIAFKRDDAVLDAAARAINLRLKQIGYEYSEVFYSFPQPRFYYCDGEPC